MLGAGPVPAAELPQGDSCRCCWMEMKPLGFICPRESTRLGFSFPFAECWQPSSSSSVCSFV